MAQLRLKVGRIGALLRDAIRDAEPSELSVELNFGLKGEIDLIPILLNGSSEGSIKVTMKWSKKDPGK